MPLGFWDETALAEAWWDETIQAVGWWDEILLDEAGTGQTIAVGQATETDAAQAVARSKARAVGLASETDAAQALASRKALAVGMASEANAARQILVGGQAQVVAVGQATEADAAFGISLWQAAPVVEEHWAHEHVLRLASDEPLALQYPEDEVLELLMLL